MKLEEGKRYVTRNGTVTGPMKRTGIQGPFSHFEASFGAGRARWSEDGQYSAWPNDKMDLMATYTEHPDPGQPDMVNEPPHYTKGGIETIDAIEAALTPEEFRGFCKANALKYIWREKHKGGDQDLAKAAWYLNRLTAQKP